MYFQKERLSAFVGRTHEYDTETRTLRYLVADDSRSLCCALAGISLDQAAAVADVCDEWEELDEVSFEACASIVLRFRFSTV